jgi:hypothetical protein
MEFRRRARCDVDQDERAAGLAGEPAITPPLPVPLRRCR